MLSHEQFRLYLLSAIIIMSVRVPRPLSSCRSLTAYFISFPVNSKLYFAFITYYILHAVHKRRESIVYYLNCTHSWFALLLFDRFVFFAQLLRTSMLCFWNYNLILEVHTLKLKRIEHFLSSTTYYNGDLNWDRVADELWVESKFKPNYINQIIIMSASLLTANLW